MLPKRLREHVGLRPGAVEVTVHGSGLHVEPIAGEALVERAGRLVVPAGGAPVDGEIVRALRGRRALPTYHALGATVEQIG